MHVGSAVCRNPVTSRRHSSRCPAVGAAGHQLKAAMMQSSPLAIVTLRRDLSARYAATTRQWLAARNAYRRLHEQPVKNIIALRDAAQRLDQLDRGRAALLRDLKALSD